MAFHASSKISKKLCQIVQLFQSIPITCCQNISANRSIVIIFILILLDRPLVYCTKSVNAMTKFQRAFNHIASRVLAGVIIADNYKIFHFFIIQIKLAYIHRSKLLATLGCTSNKSDNVMKLFYWPFFPLNLELFFYISQWPNAMHLCSNCFLVITIQKSFGGNINNIAYILKLSFFLNEIRLKFL